MLSKINDFPDRISPMLVKELRQGLRARTFVAVFLSLQIFLSIVLLSSGAAATSGRTGNTVSGIIFFFFAVVVLIIQPLRGVSALSSEIRGNTLDMMVLTRLSAWRIVFGKWVAIVSQSALILTTIVPYLILRYFFGGMDLVGEMVLLGMIFATSIALTAFTVGISGSPSVILRSLVPICMVPMIFALMSSLSAGGLSEIMRLFSLDSRSSILALLSFVAALTYLSWSMLSLGASLIAPAAENHATLRRLLSLALLALAVALSAFGVIASEFVPLYLSLVLFPALATALTESPLLVPTVCRPFVKRGAFGKLAGLILLPGWPTGVFFTLLMIALSTLAFVLHPDGQISDEITTASLAILGSLLLPATLVILFPISDQQRLANYLLLFIASGILTTVLGSISAAMYRKDFLWFFIWDPLVLLLMMSAGRYQTSQLLPAAVIVNGFFLFVLLAKACMILKKNQHVIQQAEEQLALLSAPRSNLPEA